MFADKILYSDFIFTSLSDETISGAIAIKNDKIIYVGQKDGARKFISDKTLEFDFKDNFICPGFIDNHLHFVMTAMGRSKYIADVYGKSAKECISKLKVVENVRAKDKPLIGFGWLHTAWDDSKLPTKEMIDEVYPNRPVVMQSMDAHILWMNTKGLEYFGIDKNSIPPKGGFYRKDENGELTGLIHEQATMHLLKKIYDFNDEEMIEGSTGFMDYLAKNAITSVNDMAVLAIPGADFVREDIYEKLYKQNKLKVRLNIFPQGIEDLSRALKLKEKFKDNKYLRFCGLKQFFDGVSQAHTAWLFDDYENAYFKGDHGAPVIPIEDMKNLVFNANKNKIAMRIHCIGDAAVRKAMEIFKESEEKFGKPEIGRNGIEHIKNIAPVDVDKLAKSGICANVQPAHILLDIGNVEKDLGIGRGTFMRTFGAFERAGVNMSFGSDMPVVDADFRQTLYTAITFKDPKTKLPEGGWLKDQKVSRAGALKAYTIGSARSAKREDELGSLEVGKLADIAVLDKNILSSKEDEILDCKVKATILGGEFVYRDF